VKSEKKSFKCFKSIENCPIFNFNKVTETGDPCFIYILDDYFDFPKFTKAQRKAAVESWENLFDQYLKTFGLSEHALKILMWERKIALLKCKMIEKGDYAMNAAIVVEEAALRKEIEVENKGTFEETVAFLEQYRKISIDQFKCSTKMFFTYVNIMNTETKKQKAKNFANKMKNG